MNVIFLLYFFNTRLYMINFYIVVRLNFRTRQENGCENYECFNSLSTVLRFVIKIFCGVPKKIYI